MKDTTQCLMETRRDKVRAKPLNGLDYVEMGDFTGALSGEYGEDADSQRYLTVYFLGRLRTKLPDGSSEEWRLGPANFKITGGRRITGIEVLDAMIVRPKDGPGGRESDEDDVVVLRVDKEGDFSCYTLEIVNAPGSKPAREHKSDKCRPCSSHDAPVADIEDLFDQRYRRVTFSFKANCPSTLDCVQPQVCTEPFAPPPAINYLAKDYSGFRELILDRLALILPDWKERHVPDVGIALAEILAYHADHLSYYQDAVAQEAYLDTARRRISVRRHARLVDYILHEGCNARAWVCCDPDAVTTLQPDAFDLRTEATDDTTKPLVFEPVRRQRDSLLEPGDFFDLRVFTWKLLQDETGAVTRRLSKDLRRDLHRWQRKHTAEAPLTDELVTRLVAELNGRVLHDPTYAAAAAPAGDLATITGLNRAAFDAAHNADCGALHGIYLDPGHKEILFYTWQNQDCCLEKGATECVLLDTWLKQEGDEKSAQKTHPVAQHGSDCPEDDDKKPVAPPPGRLLHLRLGDVLIFEEVTGPQTGSPNDADKTRRCAVRLTHVEPDIDRLNGTPLLRVRWAAEDAVPFSLCLSKMGPPPKCEWLEDNISVVRGNVILADHGETQAPEALGTVDREDPEYRCRCVGVLDEISVRPGPFNPDLNEPELTFAVPLKSPGPAAGELDQKPWQAVPALEVLSLPPVPDGSGPVYDLGGDGFAQPRGARRTQRHVESALCRRPAEVARLQNRHERCATVRCGFRRRAAVPGQGAAPLVFPGSICWRVARRTGTSWWKWTTSGADGCALAATDWARRRRPASRSAASTGWATVPPATPAWKPSPFFMRRAGASG